MGEYRYRLEAVGPFRRRILQCKGLPPLQRGQEFWATPRSSGCAQALHVELAKPVLLVIVLAIPEEDAGNNQTTRHTGQPHLEVQTASAVFPMHRLRWRVVPSVRTKNNSAYELAHVSCPLYGTVPRYH